MRAFMEFLVTLTPLAIIVLPMTALAAVPGTVVTVLVMKATGIL